MNPETLRKIFKSPFDYKTYSNEIVHRLFGCVDVYKTIDNAEHLNPTQEGDQSYFLGQMEDADGRLLGFFYTRVAGGSDVRRKRVGLRKLIQPYLKYDVDAAIAVFDDGRHWRLSYICDHRENITSAKRFSYILGDEQGQYKTPIERLGKVAEKNGRFKLSDLREAFSVDALSKEFFDEYHRHYDIIINELKRQGFEGATIHDYVKKMMGRIVFLHFLQKKRWLDDDPEFLKNLFFMQPLDRRADFLEKVLEPLFFGIFNTECDQRGKLFDTEHWDKELLKQWDKLPYLNGGLFERDEVDKMKLKLPASLFEDLFSFMASYNFTVDENDPDDAEVGVDPEMLGKIFESLLEDNKAKGAFYTPKEIVRYMCKESLIAYLSSRVSESPCPAGRNLVNLINTSDSVGNDNRISSTAEGGNNLQDSQDFASETSRSIRRFVETHEMQPELEPYRDILDAALRNVKICDPAIGSGAFPMGLLNELWRCREALYAPSPMGRDLVNLVESNHAVGGINQQDQRDFVSAASRSILKKEIIENNIYGVDIEKGAIDIARLRFWLAIVVDAEEPEPLPNFDYKFMQGNSLIESYKGIDLSRISNRLRGGQSKSTQLLLGLDSDLSKKNLQLLIRDYFKTADHKQKSSMRQAINDEVKRLITDFIGGTAADLAELDPSANQDFFLWHTWFKDIFDNGGFDIVIANPPYVKEYTNRAAFDGFREISPYYMGKMDLWYGFACHGLDMLKDDGIVCFIAQNNWTTSAGAKKMRNKVIKDSQILQMLDFNTYMVFENADIQTMIMLFKKNQKTNNYRFDYRIIIQDNDKEDMLALLGKKERNTKYMYPLINRESFNDGILTFSNDELIVDKMARNKTYFQAKEIGQGIVPALDDYFILYGTEGYNEEEKQYIKPYYTGLKDRYVSYPLEKYLIYMSAKNYKQTHLNNYPNLKKHFDPYKKELTEAKVKYGTPNKPYFFVHRERDENFFKSGNEKIVSQVRCKYPTFYYTTDAFYGSRALFFIRSERWNMKFLIGVLNSSLIAYWIKNKGKQQGELLKLDKEPLQGIPLPVVSISQQQPIIALVDQIITAKKNNSTANTSNLEKKIDELVYQLYNLTPEEIAIIEQ